MNILEKIVEAKRKEVTSLKRTIPLGDIMKQPGINRPLVSLKERLSCADPCGIIAEFKRSSPSKGVINEFAVIEKIIGGYIKAGASGISVLTDSAFFGGSLDDLKKARAVSSTIPILRKEFIVDEYQVVEAKAAGADVILLIAEILTPEEVERLLRAAKEQNLEVILELHHEDQLYKITEEIDIVGINNRNLQDFSVDVNSSLDIGDKIPSDRIKISESGLNKSGTLLRLIESGFRGFLIGEFFMRQAHPGEACAQFIHSIKKNAG